MTPEKAFLQAILEQPDDDAPRLVYADWLEENGDGPRAEFIRLQCRIAERDGWMHRPRASEEHDRVDALRNAYADQWIPKVLAWDPDIQWAFRRGFIASVDRDAQDWLKNPDLYHDVTPIEGIWFAEADGFVAEILSSIHFQRLRLTNLLRYEETPPLLARCPHLSRLEYLDAYYSRFTDAGAAALASANLPSLTTLVTRSTPLTISGIVAILDSKTLPRLHHLDLGATQVDSQGVATLARTPTLARITRLRFAFNRLGGIGARALAQSDHVINLVELDLANNHLGDVGLRALSSSPNLSGLDLLRLSENGLTHEGMAAFASSPHLGGMTRLLLDGNPLGSTGLRHLASSNSLSRLRVLDLNKTSWGQVLDLAPLAGSPAIASVERLLLAENEIGDKGAQVLAASPHLRCLTGLDLSGNRLGSKGAEALAESPILERLTWLDLSGNHIGIQGARALARSPYLRNLTVLHLGNNRVGDAGAKALADSPYLPPPPCFRISGQSSNRITPAGRQALRDRWG